MTSAPPTQPTGVWAAEVEPALARSWDFPVSRSEQVHGGRNGLTWRVSGPRGTAAVKLVRPGESDPAQLEAGLRLAAQLDAPDLATPAPVPAVDGRLCVDIAAGRLVVQRWIAGRPLLATRPDDIERMASVLALLHRRTAGLQPVPGVPLWPWQWLTLDTLGAVEHGDGELVDEAARAAAEVGFAGGIVHGDPTPDNFVADRTVVGLLDWASVLQGPLLYDVAVLGLALERADADAEAVRRFERCYAAAAPVDSTELAELPRLRRLRLAAELVYFTSRLSIPGRDGATLATDRVGLARTRQALRESARRRRERRQGGSWIASG